MITQVSQQIWNIDEKGTTDADAGHPLSSSYRIVMRILFSINNMHAANISLMSTVVTNVILHCRFSYGNRIRVV